MANESAFDNSVPEGRLGVTTLTTEYGVLLAGTTATGDIQNAGAGTADQVLTSNGAGVKPSFQAADTAASQAEQETGSDTTVYASPGRQQYHLSAAKSWCRWYIVAGTPTLNESYNVASLTDTAPGNVQINYTTAFSSTGYSIVSSAAAAGATLLLARAGSMPLAASCAVVTRECDNPYGITEMTASVNNVIAVAMYGDQ